MPQTDDGKLLSADVYGPLPWPECPTCGANTVQECVYPSGAMVERLWMRIHATRRILIRARMESHEDAK